MFQSLEDIIMLRKILDYLVLTICVNFILSSHDIISHQWDRKYAMMEIQIRTSMSRLRRICVPSRIGEVVLLDTHVVSLLLLVSEFSCV